MMYYLEIDLDRCDGCGICVAVCPHNAALDMMSRGGKGFSSQKVYIGVKGGCSNVLGEHLESEYCGECVQNCPQQAIKLIGTPPEVTTRVIQLEEELQTEEVTLDTQKAKIDMDQFDLERAETLKDSLTQLRERYKKRQVRQALSRGNVERAEKLLKENS